MFGTNTFKHLTKKQLASKYAQVRSFCRAIPGYKITSDEDFDSFVESFLIGQRDGIVKERNRLMCAFGQVHTTLTKTSLQITEETLRWGGFFGGDFVHDTRNADKVCYELLGA